MPRRPLPLLFAALTLVLAACNSGNRDQNDNPPPVPDYQQTHPTADARRLQHRGEASFYANHFEGKKMADGTRYDGDSNVAASKRLPLGTKARVKNLETGKTAVVEIRDRGPYVKGRVIDLTPATARSIGIDREDGVAPVEVTPISLPKGQGRG
ncbi:MAG TPA: septal ring lytic transglycosylase RlpA family protein [Plasticicumulans sp.]|nr:septal ring lytic transglycosylase RlpA family protein [Plasticicumulans sp.]